jgi:hypothetical protein
MQPLQKHGELIQKPLVTRRMGKAERAHQNAILEQMGTGDALYPSYSSLHPVFEEAESSNLLHHFSRVMPVGCC